MELPAVGVRHPSDVPHFDLAVESVVPTSHAPSSAHVTLTQEREVDILSQDRVLCQRLKEFLILFQEGGYDKHLPDDRRKDQRA